MIWEPRDRDAADLTSHDTFAEGVPHNAFRRMRDEAPVAWTEYPGGRGFWSLTRHADILAASRDPATFSSAQGIRMEDQTPEEYLARRTFQETDPPDHTVMRRKLSRAFSKPVVAAFEQAIRELCVEILDEALEAESLDATAEIARPLPMRMLGRIVGLPEEDLPWLVTKGDALMANTDPDFTPHVADRLETDAYRMMPFNSPAGAELYDYADRLMAAREEAGVTDGVLDLIRQPDEEGQAISDSDFRNFFCLLVAAGNDTTRYSLAAGIHALACQEGLLEELKAGAAWDMLADECVRWCSPATYFRRTATRDVELHGTTIRAGDKVLLWYASANRDERVFDQPFRVIPTRKPNPHLGFGAGPHVCLGMFVARLEIRVLFQELVKRISQIELDGTPAFVRSNFVGGLKRLPVRIRRA
jgi:hypothetical protein